MCAKELSSTFSVKGRLKAQLAFRKEGLNAPLVLLNVIESGYVLPLMSEPTILWYKPVVRNTECRICGPVYCRTFFDPKSGYHHVDITQNHQRYLGFSWKDRFFVFTILPFGLCSACYIFNKLMCLLVCYWRSQGLRAVVYLDNGLRAENGKQPACAASQLVFQTLELTGFAVHPVKSVQ